MTARVDPQRRGSYGVDAPIVPVIFAVAMVVSIVNFAISPRLWMLLPLLFLLGCAATYLHTTRRGKFLVWAELLDQMGLQGNERILDMGCGRGAVLRVSGVDGGLGHCLPPAARYLTRASSWSFGSCAKIEGITFFG